MHSNICKSITHIGLKVNKPRQNETSMGEGEKYNFMSTVILRRKLLSLISPHPCTFNKLLDIKPTIGEYQSVVRNIRKEEVVLARLRLGHTRVTHSYLLQGEEQPQCVGCDAPFTVRHFLLECGDFAQVRNNCCHVDNMKELFQNIHIDSIMTF